MKKFFFILATTFLVTACNPMDAPQASAQDVIAWPSVTGKRILFAHQSVGANILSGVEALAQRDGVKLNISESRSPVSTAGIHHFKVGTNTEPESKIEDFRNSIVAGAGLGADIAVLKLCYIDINTETDARALASRYIETLEGLARAYPQTHFIAVTSPLTTVQVGPKAWVKRLMGRLPSEYVENAKRAEFNAILRAHYTEAGKLFDLAAVESSSQGGQVSVTVDDRSVEVLNPALTSDGGHLNPLGQRLVATAFLQFISNL